MQMCGANGPWLDRIQVEMMKWCSKNIFIHQTEPSGRDVSFQHLDAHFVVIIWRQSGTFFSDPAEVSFELLLRYCFYVIVQYLSIVLLQIAVLAIMLSSTYPYHFSSPAIYQMFVGRRTDKGMCLTLCITDNWTQYAATWFIIWTSNWVIRITKS